jgi:hypothetical protein
MLEYRINKTTNHTKYVSTTPGEVVQERRRRRRRRRSSLPA